MTDSPSPTSSSPAHRFALIAGIVTILLGPVCVLGSTPVSGYINRITNYQAGLIPFFAFGVIYALVILLSLISLCCLLVVWGSFAVLPCGIFGC